MKLVAVGGYSSIRVMSSAGAKIGKNKYM